MKKLILLTGLLSMVQLCFSQTGKAPKFDLSFGLGVLSTFFKDNGQAITPPLHLKMDYKLRSNFSLGISLGYSATKVQRDVMNDDNPFEWVNRYKVIQLRGTVYSNNKWERWDIYGGMWIAYNHSDIKLLEGDWNKLTQHTRIRPSSGKLNVSAFVGGRFALNSKIGIYSELGLGISLITIGGSYQF